MNLFRSILGFTFFITIAFLIGGCTESKVYKIGVSQCSEDDWRIKMNNEINREIMFHEDAIVEIRSADDNNEKQIKDIKYFVDNDFDILIVSPNEAEALTPIIRNVYKKGIPVIIFDRNINDSTYTARIGVDDKGLGKMAAHYALSITGRNPKAIEIYGLKGSTPANGRHEGFVDEFLNRGGTLLATEYGDWNKEDAIVVSDSLLRIYDDVDVIFAHNDRMAIGASEVARDMGRDSIKIIGIDAAPEIGIKAVADGVIDATFLYPTEGHRLIKTALSILKGEPYEREDIIPLSSAVDKSNADILLFQNATLEQETANMKILKERIDDYWERHSSQTALFYASIAIIVLLLFGGFLLLRSFWQRSRHQRELIIMNRLLEEERDKQKQLNDQLQEATQSKLVFFTNVSHDLRTPLTLIAEPVSQLASASNLTPQQNTLIKIADKNVRILQRLINQILDFRKYENGKLNLNMSEIDLNKALHDWVDSFHAIARKRDMSLTLSVEPDGPMPLAMDVEKIERVFFNLLSNAFKYTPDNGSIAVKCRYDNEKVTITVADTGEGISERDLGNIFERFFQVDQVHPKGSGIGLALTKAFVELHNGNITVESELKKGTTFTVTLPVTHVAKEVTEASNVINSEAIEAELGNIDVNVTFDDKLPVALVIDDNKDILKLVGELLTDEYNVITASNGKAGLRMAAKYVPDIVICDVMMPVMDGLECTRRIKSEVSTSHIPVLLLTACTMDEQRVQGYDSGADGYLSKPFNSAVLKAKCASLIANRKRIKELWKSQSGIISKEQTEKSVSPEVSSRQLPTTDIDSDFYNRFLEIFTKDMGNADINVDTLARRMGLERSQFYRKIKALTNYSPVELMRRLRLEHARKMILSTDKSISEIAYDTGFSTPAYFTKCYRDAFGETPTDARTNLAK